MTRLEMTVQATWFSCFRSYHLSFTFIPAELDVGEQTDLNDLPKKPKDQVGFPFPQVLCANIDNMTPDGRCGIQCQVQVLLQTTHPNETQPGEMLLYLSSTTGKSRDLPLVLAPTAAARRKCPCPLSG